MKNSQKAFLKSLLKSIEQAKDTQEAIITGLRIGVKNEATCIEYSNALKDYIKNAERMVMMCTAAYGKGSNIIAAEAILNQKIN